MGLFRRKKREGDVAAGVPEAADPRVSAAPAPSRSTPVRIGQSWHEDLEVQGESYRRADLGRMFMAWGLPEGGVKMGEAVLEREPKNQHDPSAVKVLVNGFHVGYVGAEDAPKVSNEIRRLGRNEHAVCPVRAWGRPDDGVWRARVTLVLSGDTEPDQDYAQQRRDYEAREAEHERERAEKEAVRQRKEAGREAGSFDGQYWGNYREAVAELKRQKRLEEARDILEKCAEAAEREALIVDTVPHPWAVEQLSVVLGKLKDPERELLVLERYESACGDRSVPDKVAARLVKARLAG
jgi:hypothetical protein